MANISWTSSSIYSYFNTSLGNPSYAFGNLYNSLGDASLIKNGTYHKLMNSYFTSVAESNSSTSSQDTQTTTNKHANTYTYDSKTETSTEDSTSADTVNTATTEQTTRKHQNACVYTYDCKGQKTSTVSNKILDELI